MKRNSIILFLLLPAQVALYGQRLPQPYTTKWQFGLGAGFNFTPSPLLQQQLTDNLAGYSDHGIYIMPNTTFYLWPHWGVSIIVRPMLGKTTQQKQDRYQNSLEASYSEKYYIHTLPQGSSGDYIQGLFGAVYRLEKERWLLYSKLYIGVSSFSTYNDRILLKEKDAHTILEIQYEPPHSANDYFTIAPALSAGFKLNSWLFVNFDLMTTYYRPEFYYTRTITNQVSGQTDTEVFSRYKKDIVTVSGGVSLSFAVTSRSWRKR